MMKFFQAIALCAIAFSVQGQSLRVEVTDDVSAPVCLWLKTYDKGYWGTKDSVWVNNGNRKALTFPMGNYEGYAELCYGDPKQGLGFIYNPLEKEFLIRFSGNDFRAGNLTFLNSYDNLVYARLLEYKAPFDARLKELIDKQLSESPFDSLYYNRMLGYEKQLEHLYITMNGLCDSLVKRNTFLYSHTVAGFLKTPTGQSNPKLTSYFDGYRALLHYRYFDEVDFSQAKVLNHPAFDAKIREYFTLYCANSEASLKEGIDLLMARCPANSDVKNYVFNFLAGYFLERNRDGVVAYLYEKYMDGCGIQLTGKHQKELMGVVNTRIGATIPDIVTYDDKGAIRSLKNEAEKHAYTLLYIWTSDCHVCQTKTPKLVEQLAPYQKKGLGVFSISLDTVKEKWLLALQKYKPEKWVNVAELKPIAQSTVIPQLGLRTTPQLFVLDRNAKIVLKEVYGTQLSTELDVLLK